jgi:hypothetical protein
VELPICGCQQGGISSRQCGRAFGAAATRRAGSAPGLIREAMSQSLAWYGFGIDRWLPDLRGRHVVDSAAAGGRRTGEGVLMPAGHRDRHKGSLRAMFSQPCSTSHMPRCAGCRNVRYSACWGCFGRAQDGRWNRGQQSGCRIATATSRTWSFAEKGSHHTALMGAK